MEARSHVHSHAPHPSTSGDVLGQVISVLCLIHCAATPVVVMLAPALAGFMGGWHPVLLVGVVAAAAWAFVPGYRYHHDKTVLALAVGGVVLLGLGVMVFHFSFFAETAVTMAGAAVMLAAHWKNRQLAKRCVH